jgi:predicted NBD/HSP70 family sugar kinase
MELKEPITERRRQTRNSIYRYLYNAKGFCSKQSIARDLSLSLPTVYQNLTELMKAGLVCYSGEQRSTGGRRAKGLSIRPDARFAVGISIAENRLRLVAADLRLQEWAYRKVYHDPVEKMQDMGGFLAQQLEIFLDENQVDRSQLLGVGIALPGVISPESGLVTLAPTLSLRDITLRELTCKIPYPTYVENDATSDGYAEWFLQGNQRDMAYLLLETGVGGAVLVNGDQYHGDNRRSGEFGHMCVEPGGLSCKCGKRGCLEAYCSSRRISDDLGITVKEFFSGVENHKPEYEALWDDMLRHLAIGINNVRMALDCDVVLGGFLTQYMQPYLPRLKEYVAACNTFEPSADYLRLSSLPRHSVPLGVALHYINLFIENF